MSMASDRSAAHLRAAYAEVLGNVDALVTPLDDEAFERPTGCPGWTVHDCVAHISALESVLIGRELPDHRAPEGLPHVHGAFGVFNENAVDYRRGWSMQRVLAEYREVTARRLLDLEAVSDDDLDHDARGVFGVSKLRSVLAIRIFDIWTHEQDIRRALGDPGGFDGPAGRVAVERLLRGIGNRLAQSGTAPDGSSLALDITAPVPARRLIAFTDGAGRVVETLDGTPTVTLHMDMNTLTVLGCGRADDPEAPSRVAVEGDAELGRRYLENLAFTP